MEYPYWSLLSVQKILAPIQWRMYSDNGLGSNRRQAFIWNNNGLMSIGTLVKDICLGEIGVILPLAQCVKLVLLLHRSYKKILIFKCILSPSRELTRMVFLSASWRHQMDKFSALLAICAGNSPVPGEFPAQRPVTRSFNVFFDLRLNKRLSKQSWGWWFEMLSRPLWRHRNV